MNENLLVFRRAEAIPDCAAERWSEIALDAVRSRGFFTAALSGGRTPEPFYSRLAEISGLPWPSTHLFMVDERFVPAGHPDSNARLIRTALVDSIIGSSGFPPGNFHPIPTDQPSPALAADAYEREIRSFFDPSCQHSAADPPSLDLVVLGAGEDGHTASLFPGHTALAESRRIVAPVLWPKHDRVTLTLPVLNRARNAIFLLTGRKKASILRRILQKDIALPASLVRPETGNLFILADAEAGSEVRSEILDP